MLSGAECSGIGGTVLASGHVSSSKSSEGCPGSAQKSTDVKLSASASSCDSAIGWAANDTRDLLEPSVLSDKSHAIGLSDSLKARSVTVGYTVALECAWKSAPAPSILSYCSAGIRTPSNCTAHLHVAAKISHSCHFSRIVATSAGGYYGIVQLLLACEDVSSQRTFFPTDVDGFPVCKGASSEICVQKAAHMHASALMYELLINVV